MLRTLMAMALAFAALTAANATEPATVLHGTLTGKDNKTWRVVPFEVPPGTTRITVDFDYTTRDTHTTIDLGLRGPDGFRGWSGGNKRSFTIAATDATPSYLPGAIQPGQWNLLLGIPNIRPGVAAEYTANIRFEHNEFTVLRAAPGWYRGDLHMHTAHSDGSCLSRRQQRVPCPAFLTVQAASSRGLDFIAITDHNTTSHAAAIRELQPYFDDLLLIPGRELTTFEGHANLYGTLAPLDFRVGSTDVPDWNTLLANIAQTGGLLSINHPIRPSGEECMGCGWTPKGEVNYAHVQAVEVVNGRDADTAYSGIGFWEHLLNQGYELTAIGGSDTHDADNSDSIGTPTTVIYADMLSQPAILAAIRRGRVFVDVAGTHDRSLDLQATLEGQTAHMGDMLAAPRGARVRFSGTITAVAGGEIEVILDGARAALLKDPRINTPAESFEFPWRSDGGRHWLRIDVRDPDGHLALVGNPVYIRANH
jgi:hypothetical protein